jgi:hypothetical protein
MTLVIWGLLFGLAVLVWATVIDLMRTDQRSQKKADSPDPRKPVRESGRCESKAA